MSLASGERLGRYEIRGLLGKGGMAEVYRAHDLETKRDEGPTLADLLEHGPIETEEAVRAQGLQLISTQSTPLSRTLFGSQLPCAPTVRPNGMGRHYRSPFEIGTATRKWLTLDVFAGVHYSRAVEGANGSA